VIWLSTGAKLESSAETATAAQTTPSSQLLKIPPRSRQAFLLTALEGFTPGEAGQILDIDVAEVEQLIAAAESEIDTTVAADILIIEDEPVIATDLAALAHELGHQVIGVAATHAEAIDAVARHRPGLVLADIQLADGSSGIEAVRDILARFAAPVIFITAHPEQLLTGERPEPTFVITKPFQPEMVKAAIGQALFFHPARDRQVA
jgi:CheY-like chemotaxis protein